MDQLLSVLTTDDHYMTGSLLEPVKCAGCEMPITDAVITRIGESSWHDHCTKCSICETSLLESCFQRDSKLFCRLHYYRQFSPYTCVGCGHGISPNDVVYKLSDHVIYHTHCHCCNQCGRPLCPGDQIIVNRQCNTISCYSHFEESSNDSSMTPMNPSLQRTSSVSSAIDDPRNVDMKDFSTDSLMVDMYAHMDPDGGYGYFGDDMDSKFLKRRGPRTTIKQNQLDVLNRIFTATPKPSKHARAKLALETGLSMRVIQVWFQNRRSKERRLKHLCNWIRENENRGFIPPMSPAPSGSHGLTTSSSSGLPPASELTSTSSYLASGFRSPDSASEHDSF